MEHRIADHQLVELKLFDMSKSSFAKLIIDKLAAAIGTDGGSFDSGSATKAMSAVASAITEYLISNTTVDIVYTGIIASTPPQPDPVVKDSFKIVGSCKQTVASDSFDIWIKQIESNIINGFQLAPKGTSGVIFAQKPFLNPGISVSQSDLKSIYDISDESPQQKVWEVICDSIIKWIGGVALNPAPGSASRPNGPSSGTANIVKININ